MATGYGQNELVGNTLSLIKSGAQSNGFYRNLWKTILSGQPARNIMTNKNKSGKVYHVDQTITPLKNKMGEIMYFMTICKDVTEQQKSQELIQHQAFHDPLTQLPNRAYIYDNLEIAIKKARRNKERLGILFIDLDKFKPVNDTYGHHAGDEVLRKVAGRLRNLIRESDTVGRLGGDEFIVIMASVIRGDDTIKVAQQIIKTMKRQFIAAGNKVRCGASIGIAFYPDHAIDIESLLQNADAAMMRIKKSGGNGYNVHTLDN